MGWYIFIGCSRDEIENLKSARPPGTSFVGPLDVRR